MLKNPKAKGARAERRAVKILEDDGWVCTRSGASLGIFDILAMHPKLGWRCLQVKANHSFNDKIEKEIFEMFQVPPLTSKELWIFYDRVKEPLIEVFN